MGSRKSFKSKCIITSPTKAGFVKAVNKYFYSTNWILTDDNKLYNTKLEKFIDGSIFVCFKDNRWQLRTKLEK